MPIIFFYFKFMDFLVTFNSGIAAGITKFVALVTKGGITELPNAFLLSFNLVAIALILWVAYIFLIKVAESAYNEYQGKGNGTYKDEITKILIGCSIIYLLYSSTALPNAFASLFKIITGS